MMLDQEVLSGFLDGELGPEEKRKVETALAEDPGLRAELELLMASNARAQAEFDDMLSQPVSSKLVDAINKIPLDNNADLEKKPRVVGWVTALAASLVLLIGGAGGYLIGTNQQTQLQVAALPGWLADISDYHRIYSTQSRHLVEVPAEQADHIEKWLTKTVGADVRIPDLSKHGLTFQGARLLVAAAKPVAQLMFKDADGKIIALCIIRNNKAAAKFVTRTVGEFEMVSWSQNLAGYVIIGEINRGDLPDIASTTAQDAKV